MNSIARFGPHGNSASFLSSHKSSLDAPKWLSELGLSAFEYAGGNGITASAETFRKLGDKAAEFGIALSLHTPYYISLSGAEEKTRLGSLRYIKQSVECAEAMRADTIVIHAGSAGKMSRAEAMELAADTLTRALDEIKTDVIFGIETMGKINQLGTLEEVIELCKISPRLRPVVDFGHLNARAAGGVFTNFDDYRRVFDLIGGSLGDIVAQKLHCHFSKIEYTGAGERRHLTFADDVFGPPFEPLIEAIVKENLAPRIICESDGTMAEDALTMKNFYDKIKDGK